MVLVSHSHKFIFLKTRKTAGTSVEMYLQPFCTVPGHVVTEKTDALVSAFGIVGRRLTEASDDDTLPWHNHLRAGKVRRVLGDQIWSAYRKLTVVRNPFARMVSGFYWANRATSFPGESFGDTRARFHDFVRTDQLQDDTDIVFIRDAYVIDDAVRFETLSGDLTNICAAYGLDPAATRLPFTKVTADTRDRHPIAAYYDTTIADAVRRSMSWVFDRFDYPERPDEAL